MSKKGFTLIELLIVIAIIAILAAVVLVALGNARTQAQDSARKSDLNSIMTAVELYKTTETGDIVPDLAALCGVDGVFCDDTVVCTDNVFTGAIHGVYIQNLPVDPDTTTNYGCSVDASGNYTVTATLIADGGGTFTCENGSCHE